MTSTARPETRVTDPEIAAYLARNPEPLFRRFASTKHRTQHAGDRTTAAQDRQIRRR